MILFPRTHLIFFWEGHGLILKALNLDERSLYLRHEGHEMKYKFMTQGQSSKDQQRVKEKIDKKKYKLQKEEKLKKKKRKKR